MKDHLSSVLMMSSTFSGEQLQAVVPDSQVISHLIAEAVASMILDTKGPGAIDFFVHCDPFTERPKTITQRADLKGTKCYRLSLGQIVTPGKEVTLKLVLVENHDVAK